MSKKESLFCNLLHFTIRPVTFFFGWYSIECKFLQPHQKATIEKMNGIRKLLRGDVNIRIRCQKRLNIKKNETNNKKERKQFYLKLNERSLPGTVEPHVQLIASSFLCIKYLGVQWFPIIDPLFCKYKSEK